MQDEEGLSKSESSVKLFTKETLIEHAKSMPNSSFIIIRESVYDVTLFLNEVTSIILSVKQCIYINLKIKKTKHPGGDQIIRKYQIDEELIDATRVFDDFEHSKNALLLLKKFLIGSIVKIVIYFIRGILEKKVIKYLVKIPFN